MLGGAFNESEALGAAVWLWMHSKAHRNAPLHMLSPLLLPAIKNGQFVLGSENGKPVFYLAWARFSEEAEQRYLGNAPQCMREEDWCSGERVWFLDWVAPFGHSRKLRTYITRRLFPGCCARFLYHRGDQKGLRVMRFHGIAVTPAEARFWFENNPPAIQKQLNVSGLEK
ncbi:MAG: toxin-activating lysine-acyltransferase [Propionivibrio sp.]